MAKTGNTTNQEPLNPAAQVILEAQEPDQGVLPEQSLVQEAQAEQTMKTDETIQQTNPAPEVPEQPLPAIPLQSSSTVFVAMNYPHNVKFIVPDRDGMMSEVELVGNAAELRGQKMGVLPIGAYGVTEIDRDAWGYIRSHYAGLPLIRNGLIFATEFGGGYAKAAAAERGSVRNGYEPVDPKQTTTKPADKTEV